MRSIYNARFQDCKSKICGSCEMGSIIGQHLHLIVRYIQLMASSNIPNGDDLPSNMYCLRACMMRPLIASRATHDQ